MESCFFQEGTIDKISGNIISVSVTQNAACVGCHAQSDCHISRKEQHIIKVIEEDHLYKEGEKVTVSMQTSLGMKAVWYAFALPLILLFLSLFVCWEIFQKEILAVVISIVITTIYYLVLYLFRNKLEKKFVFRLKKITE